VQARGRVGVEKVVQALVARRAIGRDGGSVGKADVDFLAGIGLAENIRAVDQVIQYASLALGVDLEAELAVADGRQVVVVGIDRLE